MNLENNDVSRSLEGEPQINTSNSKLSHESDDDNMQTDGCPEDDRPDTDSDVLTQRDIQMDNDNMTLDQEIIQNNNQLMATTQNPDSDTSGPTSNSNINHSQEPTSIDQVGGAESASQHYPAEEDRQ